MKKYLILLLLLALVLPGCAGQDAPETTVPSTAASTETTAAPTTVPPTTVPPTRSPAATLRSGYYLLEYCITQGVALEGEEAVALKCYLYLDPDGTGFFSMMGSTLDLTWSEEVGLKLVGIENCTVEGDCITLDASPMFLTLRYHEGELPEEYKTMLPTGYFLVSSVGVQGNVEFYSAADPANGYIRLNEDGTGTLFYWGVTAELTMDGQYIYWNDTMIPYMYHSAESSPDGMAMLLLIFSEQETTVILRPAEEPAE